jgi:AcrR family transcriptional regulator
VQRAAYHHGNLAQAIVDEARRLIESEGLDRFSLAAVARSLGVSSGSPYHHFKDAREVLQCVADQAYGQMMDRVRSAVAGVTPTEAVDSSALRAAMTVACHEFLQYSIDHPVLFRMSVTDYRPNRDSGVFQFGSDFMRDSMPLLAATGMIDMDRAEDFRSATYVVLRGIASVVEEAPRLVAGLSEPHRLLDQLLDALFLAFAPTN